MKPKEKWSKNDVNRLIACVKLLNLAIPPDPTDIQWSFIDEALRKPPGSSINKLLVLLEAYHQGGFNPFTEWTLISKIKDLMSTEPQDQKVFEESVEDATSVDSFHQDLSLLNVSSISAFPQQEAEEITKAESFLEDPDTIFTAQLLREIHQLDPKTKSYLKLQVNSLVHQLKFGPY